MPGYHELTDEQLANLPTHRLLKVYRRMLEDQGYSRYDAFERGRKAEELRWNELNRKTTFIKTVLNTRGHVETGEAPKHKTADGTSLHRASNRRIEMRKQRQWHWYNLGDYQPTEPRIGPIAEPETAIGKQVQKISKKPFKSKNFYNTVKSVTINPHTNREAFTFEEDTSIVDCHICKLRKKG